MVWSKYADNDAPSFVVAWIVNRHRPDTSRVLAAKWPGSKRIKDRRWVFPPGMVAVAVAEAMRCSAPDAWKNVKWTVSFPGFPGSTYVCTVVPPDTWIV
jgi:hypothetical protein